LPLETGAPKKTPEDDISAQRPEIGDHHAREWAAKAAFLPVCVNIRVSEDWMVADTVMRNWSPQKENRKNRAKQKKRAKIQARTLMKPSIYAGFHSKTNLKNNRAKFGENRPLTG